MERVIEHGFRPQLFSVAAGSLASNSTYGTDVPEAQSILVPPGPSSVIFDSITLRGNSNSNAQTITQVSQEGRTVNFSSTLTIDTSLLVAQLAGLTQTEEVKLRVKALSSTEPAKYGSGLPPFGFAQALPLFDGEIVDETGAALAPVLSARANVDGTLALIGAAGAPLLVSDVSALLGQAAGSLAKFVIRGTYQSP